LKKEAIHVDILDDISLWKKIRMGDEKAFSVLFKKYYGQLTRYGNSFAPFDEKVKDCVQDVFADIWVYRELLNESVVVKAYLLSSVRKRMARLKERERIFHQTDSIDSLKFLLDFSVEQHLIADETIAEKVKLLNKLLNNLPERQKESLYLRYHQGLSVEEVAAILDVNYQSANNLLHRALQTLRKEWKEDFSLLLLLCSTFPQVFF
jgi:RNA polymerase sigma factor (sigma-70 family)